MILGYESIPFRKMLWICAFNFNSQIPQTILAEPEPIKKRLGMFFFLLETLWLHWRRIFRCYRHKKQSQQIDRDGRCGFSRSYFFQFQWPQLQGIQSAIICRFWFHCLFFASYTSIFNASRLMRTLHAQCRWASGRPVDQRFNSKPWRPNFVSNMFHPRSIRWCI